MYKLANWVPRSELNKPMFTPEIEYDFSVIDVRDEETKSGKPILELLLNIHKPDGNVVGYTTNLSLHEKMLWQVLAFLDCIGAGFMWDKAQDEGLNLPELGGRNGKLIFKIEKYIGQDGNEKESLKVKKFIKKDDAVKTPILQSEPLVDDDLPW